MVTLIADADFEGNEVATFTLTNPTLGATIGAKSTFNLTITDAQPTIFFSAPTVTVSEKAASATITVKRAGGVLTDTVQVNYATSAGSADPRGGLHGRLGDARLHRQRHQPDLRGPPARATSWWTVRPPRRSTSP